MLVSTDRGFLVGGQAFLLGEGEHRVQAWAERFVRKDPDIKFLLGNYVEANQVNLNGHTFPLAELAPAVDTILDKPLNMLHREQHIVGTFVGAQLLTPEGAELTAEDVPAVPEGVNPYVEALSALWYRRFPEEYFDIKRAHAEGSLYYCVDPETEILTEDGWRRHDEIAVGDKVLTLNTGAGGSEWLPLQAVNTFEHDGEVLRLEGRMHSSVTTMNHRWWIRRKRSRGGFVNEWRTSESLTTLTSIPRAVPYREFPEEPKWSDAFVELVGWFWTEGSLQGGMARIYQSDSANPGYCQRIRQALEKVYGPPSKVRDGGSWYERDGSGDIRQFIICTEAAKLLVDVAPEKVPSSTFLRSLTAAQAELFFETSIAADGHEAKADGQINFTQKDERRIRAFEFLCALLGRPTNTGPLHEAAGEGWRCCVVRRSDYITPLADAARGKGFEVSRDRYVGTVWCPTTENGTFLARRRGTVFWTGNSMEAIPAEVSCPTCDVRAEFDGLESETYCEHMQGATGPKVLYQPVFCGGAIVIPPAKPGWQRADMKTIARYMADPNFEAQAESVYAQLSHDLPHLGVTEWEAMMAEIMMARSYSSKQRQEMAKKGQALPDGSYPIVDMADLRNAMQAFGRSKPADRAKVKAHILKRAKALNAPAGVISRIQQYGVD